MANLRRYCGPAIMTFDGRTVREYCGPAIYEVDGNKIRRYCGPYIYEVDGFLTGLQWMALITLLFARA